MSASNVEGIILAAGQSTRMGTDKLSLEISGQTILYHILMEAIKSALDKIIIVNRHCSRIDNLEELCTTHKWRILNVINRKPKLGMSYSIKLGMAKVTDGSDGVMILLADQVFLNSFVIDMLISASLKSPGRIIVPTIRGRRTTPVIFPSILFPDLKQIGGDQGGREILKTNRGIVKTIEFGDRYDDIDVDTKDDYLKIISKFKHQPNKIYEN
ncbi:MAG: nucleotidyltransferase family protein [Desulfomonilaceae bacterium]